MNDSQHYPAKPSGETTGPSDSGMNTSMPSEILYKGSVMRVAPVLLLWFCLFALQEAWADIYKVIGADGRVTYTDREPQAPGVKSEKLDIRTYGGPPSISTLEKPVSRVTILSAQWCGVCTQAKNYMRNHNIAFEEWDIDKSDYARSKMRQLGAKGVPVILVGNQKMVGFSESGLAAMLKKSQGR